MKHCPFCGYKGNSTEVIHIEGWGWAVMCDTCGALGPVINEQDGIYWSKEQNEKTAIENWNERNSEQYEEESLEQYKDNYNKGYIPDKD